MKTLGPLSSGAAEMAIRMLLGLSSEECKGTIGLYQHQTVVEGQ
jgi:hypothetical protein